MHTCMTDIHSFSEKESNESKKEEITPYSDWPKSYIPSFVKENQEKINDDDTKYESSLREMHE